MIEHPIIFSAPMVRALLAGRKSVTRRLADYSKWKKGDRLWVREAFVLEYDEDSGDIIPHYRASEPEPHIVTEEQLQNDSFDDRTRWKPSIHMPRTASRITLELTEDVTREPLLPMDESEALREGFVPVIRENGALAEMRTLWNALHPKAPWSSHPTVSVIRFKVIT